MKVLFEAIYARWLSEGKLGLTQLYNTEADNDAVFPYGVFTTNITPDDPGFGEEGENCLIMFVLYSKETLSTEVCQAFEAFKAAFDKHDLAVDGYEPISLTREPANMIRIEKVWQYSVTYSLLIQKN